MEQSLNILKKPLLRGHLHQAFFFFTLGASLMFLINVFHHQYIGTLLVYLTSLNLLYFISALYHRPNWSEKKRMMMRRLDHSAIFILIAGTATPIIATKIPTNMGTHLQVANWSIALLGIFVSLIWVKSPKIFNAVIYILAGGFWFLFLKIFYQTMNTFEFFALIIGGVFYIIGALIYAFKIPNLMKNIFEYHELFHLFVIFGSLAHLALIAYAFLK